MHDLVIRSSNGRRLTRTLGPEPLRIGRGPECDLDLGLDDPEVSRRHADIWVAHDGRVHVRDLQSKNGTRVDGGDFFRGETRVMNSYAQIGEHVLQIAETRDGGEDEAPVTFNPIDPQVTAPGQFTVFPSSRQISLSQDRLALLMKLSERISGASFDRRVLLRQALDGCFEAFGLERGMIAVKTARGEVELPVARDVEPEQISRTIVNRALNDGERTIVNTPADAPTSESLVRQPVCSALCVPILYQEEVMGVIYGDRVTRGSSVPYGEADVDFLAAIAQQVGVGLATQRALMLRLRMEEIERDLNRARDIQKKLLPTAALEVGCLRFEGFNEPSAGVSGDYYDFVPLDDGRVVFVIADVVGHGLPAALLTTYLKAAFHVAPDVSVSLADAARRINVMIARSTAPHVFVTAILGVADTQTGEIRYVGAGHPPPVIVTRDGVSDAPLAGGLPLGIDETEVYVEHTIPAPCGPAVTLLFTDGLFEAANHDGKQIGMDAIRETLRSASRMSCSELFNTIRQRLRRHLAGLSNDDDLTLLAIERCDPTAPGSAL